MDKHTNYKIGRQVCYIDTIQVFFEKRFPYRLVRKLKLKKDLIVRKYREGTWIQIQLPTRDDIKSVIEEENGILSRVDMSLDIETIDAIALANNLTKVIALKNTIKGHGAHKKRTSKNCTYFRTRTSRRNLVIYGDKLSKVTGLQCLHIELRLKGAAGLVKKGITLQGLLASEIDIRNVILKGLKLSRNRKNCLNFAVLSPLLQAIGIISEK